MLLWWLRAPESILPLKAKRSLIIYRYDVFITTHRHWPFRPAGSSERNLLEPRSTMITQSAHIDQMSETPLSLSLSLSLSRSLARSLARSSLSLALALAHSLALFRARARSLPLLPFWCAVDIAAGGWLPRLCVAVQVLRQWAGVWCVIHCIWCLGLGRLLILQWTELCRLLTGWRGGRERFPFVISSLSVA